MKKFITNNNNCKINYVFQQTNVETNQQTIDTCPKVSYEELLQFWPKDLYKNCEIQKHNGSEKHTFKVNHSNMHPENKIVYLNWHGEDENNKVNHYYKFIVDGHGYLRVLYNNSRGSVSMGLVTKFNQEEIVVEYMSFSASLGLELNLTETYKKTKKGIKLIIDFNHPDHNNKTQEAFIN